MKNRLCHAVTGTVLIGVMIPSRVNEGKPRGLMYTVRTKFVKDLVKYSGMARTKFVKDLTIPDKAGHAEWR